MDEDSAEPCTPQTIVAGVTKATPFTLAFDCWSLGVEAWSVIGLRIPRLMAGNPAAAIEAHRMVAEKIEAVAILQWKMMTGELGRTGHEALAHSVAHYRKAVAKNRRRLGGRRAARG
ncbi:hypothetical protein K3M67_07225 [Sphingobium sp. V4]|uniref:hypothetical protein n=1 Tax=Sphingobium sp. V4 TaxID=3038927 RepID=UPI0025583626|nr:hypothetical protein [Sphingobium sp. V4]WIW89735.1 hypothetical protein K3M67_07225 [Sphingobium sp. V4]